MHVTSTAFPPAPRTAPLIGPHRWVPAAPAVATAPVTVIIPAFNEADSITATIASLRDQTVRPAEILVVDDCSTDGTGWVAEALGVRVLRPPANTGSKAGAQQFALASVTTEFTIALDADTAVAPDALERLLAAFDDPNVAAACSTVLPRKVRTIWERGRYVEYLFAFTFYKPVQDQYAAPMISSGCLSMYRTEMLRAAGGWSARTLAEDMDLTWTLHQMGLGVRFVAEAVCEPIEPATFNFLRKQLRRWSHGFVQNVRLHWKGLLDVPFLRSAVAVSIWDAAIASVAYLLVLPVVAVVFQNPWLLLGYVIDLPAIAVPVLIGASRRGEIGRALVSLPCFVILRPVNAWYFLQALWVEVVAGRRLTTYEKGH